MDTTTQDNVNKEKNEEENLKNDFICLALAKPKVRKKRKTKVMTKKIQQIQVKMKKYSKLIR